jgi:hypothetical protein
MKTTKTVQFCKGSSKPTITVYVKGYNRLLNPPKAKIAPAIIENGIMKYGF